jgi:hypothetical protein
MAAADLLCKFTGLFGGLADLHHRQAQAMADTQRRQRQHHHHAVSTIRKTFTAWV